MNTLKETWSAWAPRLQLYFQKWPEKAFFHIEKQGGQRLLEADRQAVPENLRMLLCYNVTYVPTL